MTDADVRREVQDCIAHYEAHGNCWLSAVGFIIIRHLFGGLVGLYDGWRPYARRKT